MGASGIDDLLYIDDHILKEGKTRRKNVTMVYIDNKKGLRYCLTKLNNRFRMFKI